MEDRLRRSLLYVPASSPAMIAKAGTRGADVLILDLEDGVRPEARGTARAQAERLWSTLATAETEVLLRINSAGSSWHEADLELAARLQPAGVVLPKCETVESAVAVDRRLGGLTPLFFMIETARGVLAAAEIARAPRAVGLLFGAADYRESVRGGRLGEEQELLVPRSAIVLAARSAGIGAFDTPWFEYRDETGLEASARRARALGFDGKTAIHPAQVPAINRVFAPNPAEVERAERIVAALEEAAAAGRAVATVDGEMVEGLHLAEARRTLARARAARR
jgi:citrate lyase beta subunit